MLVLSNGDKPTKRSVDELELAEGNNVFERRNRISESEESIRSEGEVLKEILSDVETNCLNSCLMENSRIQSARWESKMTKKQQKFFDETIFSGRMNGNLAHFPNATQCKYIDWNAISAIITIPFRPGLIIHQ